MDKETLQKAIDKLDLLLWTYQSSMIPQSMDVCIRHGGIEDGIRESIGVLESLMNGETPKFEKEKFVGYYDKDGYTVLPKEYD